MKKIRTDAKSVLSEYKIGTDYKASLGNKGLFEQSKINGRFYVGDQWYGARCGNDRPLVRRNIIKRIGEYKISTISAADISVNFTAEGVATNTISDEDYKTGYDKIVSGNYDFTGQTDDLEISMIMNFLTSYGRSTIERLNFNKISREALENAYISGTGLVYTYWDELTETGLYADENKNVQIKGDIACEVIDIENVVFGDPNTDNIQKQPYIIIAQRKDFNDVRREAKRNRIAQEEIEQILPDGANVLNFNAGTRGENEPENSKRVTVYTKFYKEWDESGNTYKVMCVRTTEKALVRRPWNIGISLYPLAKMSWERRRSSIYGDSEITYIIPNQIAINRALSAEVWATMSNGMPIMLANGDVITGDITNDPGQIIKIYGDNNDVAGAVRYVQPPSFAAQMITSVNDLANNTLTDSGANDAALGNLRPDNASAIIQMREAALQPLQIKQNQYYSFIEDNMRIWAQFWLNLYGDRRLKIDTPNGIAYVPFHASRYNKLLINAKIDVGASTVWSIATQVSSLDALLTNGIITPMQYLERMPPNIIPRVNELIEELKTAQQAAEQPPAPVPQPEQVQGDISDREILDQWAQQNPEMYERFMQLSPEEQTALLSQSKQGGAPV